MDCTSRRQPPFMAFEVKLETYLGLARGIGTQTVESNGLSGRLSGNGGTKSRRSKSKRGSHDVLEDSRGESNSIEEGRMEKVRKKEKREREKRKKNITDREKKGKGGQFSPPYSIHRQSPPTTTPLHTTSSTTQVHHSHSLIDTHTHTHY